jgi:hypothetical protein
MEAVKNWSFLGWHPELQNKATQKVTHPGKTRKGILTKLKRAKTAADP